MYVLGRTSRGGPKPSDRAAGTIEDTAEEVTDRGGKGIPLRVDCTIDGEVAQAFGRIGREEGRLDVLANAVWGAADSISSLEDVQSAWGKPFWEQSAQQWPNMMTSGPHAYYLASFYAAQIMARQGSGLIVGVTDGYVEGGSSDDHGGQLIWDLAHTTINRLMLGMAHELMTKGIAVITLMPGFMQTERVLQYMTTDELKKMFRFDLSESTEYIGRAVAALANDKKVIVKTGKVHFVADLAREYGFTDIDGRLIPRFNPRAGGESVGQVVKQDM